jgi:hypothetical protein
MQSGRSRQLCMYGRLRKSCNSPPLYRLAEGVPKDVVLIKKLLSDCDHFVAVAAMIGGIAHFHEFASTCGGMALRGLPA